MGQIGAVGLAAVLFGAAHLPLGAMGMLFAGVLGFALGLIMVLHRSVWPAVIAHGVFDATSLALLPWVMEKMNS
jgi:membrane protease YdiL (CAAX protease family)